MFSTSQNPLRPLHINFELYVDSDDVEFKIELIRLMISNVEELVNAANFSIENLDATPFNKAIHKTKSTVSLLDDAELNELLENIKQAVATSSLQTGRNDVDKLNVISKGIIESLNQELRTLDEGKI